MSLTRERRAQLKREAQHFSGRILSSECDSFDEWKELDDEENAFLRGEVRKIAWVLQAKGRPGEKVV